jgi:hypothetical protein
VEAQQPAGGEREVGVAILFLSRNTVSFLAILIEVCILIYAFYFSNCVSRAQVNNFND